MTYRIEIANNATSALAAAGRVLADCTCRGGVPVLLVPSPAAVARIRHSLSQGDLALGVRVETLSAWVEDRWELFGDGRRIISPAERTLLVQRALAQVSGSLLEPTPGVVDLVSSLARDALPFLVSEDAFVAEDLLSAGERAVISVLKHYACMLAEGEQCEVSQAAAMLPSMMLFAAPLVLLGFDELSCAYRVMLEELAQCVDVVRVDDGCLAPDGDSTRVSELQELLGQLFSPHVEGALEPTGAVRFSLPAGRYAAFSLIAEEVLRATQRERANAVALSRSALPTVVVCREPGEAFAAMADYLSRCGMMPSVVTRKQFSNTEFGRAFLALARFALDVDLRVSLASDFALSPFSGLSQRMAWALDAAWRGDRTVDHARIAADLAAASESAAFALTAFAGDDMDGALADFEIRLRQRTDFDTAFRAEQLAAVGAARRLAQAALEVGVSVSKMLPLLEHVSVSMGKRAGAEDAALSVDTLSCTSSQPDVLFMDLTDAAEQPSCSCSTLLLCDLSARAYPVRANEDGGTLLLEKLGLARPADALTASRRRFFRALAAAREAVVCERPLNTVDGDEAYPAVMYEELLDCYRVSSSQGGDLDRATGLPRLLVSHARTAGEDDLHANLALGCDVSEAEVWEVPASGEVSAAARSRVVLAAVDVPQAKSSLLPLSPSAIESYLECPCKWFSLRRLRLSEPDAGFGPLEMGSFSHGVLKSFYEHFIDGGYAKVSPDNLAEARIVMEQVFDRHLAFQPSLKRNRNPLVPRTSFEQTEARDLKRRLVRYLDRESILLPGFVPTHFELDFGTAELFPYAGCALRGSVDRIDVNDRGQAVVIDYKGTLTEDYALAAASPAAQAKGALLPHKVQALVYAQVAKRLLGYDVVGALYVSYGRDGRVAGALDRGVLGEQAVPAIDIERCGVPGSAAEALGVSTFSQVTELVEEGIATAAQSMAEGLVLPDPRGKDPCSYCPVLACERRRSS